MRRNRTRSKEGTEAMGNRPRLAKSVRKFKRDSKKRENKIRKMMQRFPEGRELEF